MNRKNGDIKAMKKIENHKKQFYEDNREKIRDQQKKYYDENRDVIIKQKNFYEKNRINTDIKYRLIKNTRRRIHHALDEKTKSLATREILGIDIDTYKHWIDYHFTHEMNWSNIEIVHVRPHCMFVVTKDDELKEAFCWKYTQPLIEQDHQKKGIKFNFLNYQLHFIKANHFFKIEGKRRIILKLLIKKFIQNHLEKFIQIIK